MHPYSAASSYGLSSTLLALVFVAIILRFVTRLKIQRTYIGLDDWSCLLGAVLVSGQFVIGTLSTCPSFFYPFRDETEEYDVSQRCGRLVETDTKKAQFSVSQEDMAKRPMTVE